jgi:hypothetical protein
VIVGLSAGGLIGFQFVVMTLLANMPNVGSDPQVADAFTTPTVIHFLVVCPGSLDLILLAKIRQRGDMA